MLENRITLRPLQTKDSTHLHRWFNNQRVLENLGARHIFFCVSLEEERRIVEKKIEDDSEKNFVILCEEEVPIGLCVFTNIDRRNASTEIQVIIGEEEYWGQGYGKEIVETMLDYAFNVMNMHRVYLKVAAYNDRAISCYRSCGFQVEGELRDDHFHLGEYRNTLMMSVLRQDYRGEQDAGE